MKITMVNSGLKGLIGIFTHLELCLSDAIHSLKGVEIFQIFRFVYVSGTEMA